MYNITRDIENEIIDAINSIIDEYLQGRTSGTRHARSIISRKDYDSYFDGVRKTIYDAKKEFLKPNAISKLIEDIKWAGYRNYTKISGIGDSKLSEQRYINLVTKLLNDIIRDRIALEKDKQVMEIKKFENYNLLEEINNMSDEDCEKMVNENKKAFEAIYYDLQYLKTKLQQHDEQFKQIKDILKRNNLK
ncbi:MAG: hypothetical protein HPY57_15870 [Ignavibacteria bacterium]|nr:hypothetical protein [Ignavibacteria bacterium]